MQEQTLINITKLENLDELNLLIRGDAIQRIDTSSMNGVETVAYHRINRMEHFEFLFPAFMREEYIIMDRVRKSIIQIVDGKIVYNRDRCAIESFSQNHPQYEELNKTLQIAGLR